MVEADRPRFMDLFANADFTVFWDGPLTKDSANVFVDHLLELGRQVPFAKQSIIVRSTGEIVGYAGVDWFDLDGEPHLEFGYRLMPDARGLGYATEASSALLGEVPQAFDRPIYALIDPENSASINTIGKLDFLFWKEAPIGGVQRNLYVWQNPADTYKAPAASPT